MTGSSDLVEYTSIAFGVFGGCCTNAFSLETLLQDNPSIASALTFTQLLFIAGQSLPSFLEFKPRLRLKKRHVPIRLWLIQVVILTSVSLLNNWAFGYNVPLSLLILVRSAGLVVAMCVGYLFLHKKYTPLQIISVILVSVGVMFATLSRPTPPRPAGVITTAAQDADNDFLYFVGVSMLFFALALSGILGALQEKTFDTYGPHWEEGVFYTNLMSIPMFTFLLPEVIRGLRTSFYPPISLHGNGKIKMGPYGTLIAIIVNLVTQTLCVKGVNRLTSRVSSVTANLIMTSRKALSLCISVWWFGNGWNGGMTIGAALVFLGSIMYGLASPRSSDATKDKDKKTNGKATANGNGNGHAKEDERDEVVESKKER